MTLSYCKVEFIYAKHSDWCSIQRMSVTNMVIIVVVMSCMTRDNSILSWGNNVLIRDNPFLDYVLKRFGAPLSYSTILFILYIILGFHISFHLKKVIWKKMLQIIGPDDPRPILNKSTWFFCVKDMLLAMDRRKWSQMKLPQAREGFLEELIKKLTFRCF